MRSSRLSVLFTILVLIASVLACNGNFTTANIGNAWLSTDDKGNNKTTIFSPTDTFNLFLELHNAPTDTALKVSWIAVNVQGQAPNSVLHETDYTSSDDTIRFYLSNDSPWPTGSYKVEVYLNGKLDKTITFDVK